LIEFEIANGHLIVDPGQAGIGAATFLSAMLGIPMLQPTAPGTRGVRCMIEDAEYFRHLEGSR
jgi:hypothetical protein